MTSPLTLRPIGIPAPQGSKSGFYNPKLGRVQMVESSKKVKPWRQDVIAAASNAIAQHTDWTQLEGPLELTAVFYFTRPGYHYRTGRYSGELRPNAPRFVDKKPDLDKIIRSTLDGLGQAGVYKDDSQVVRFHQIDQIYADPGVPPGALITIAPIDSAAPAPSDQTPAGAAAPNTEGALW